MTKSETAKQTYDSGFNCCQAILTAFGPDYGYDREQFLKMGTAMGAGVGRSEGTCGAVTGAVMAIGMKYGMKDTSGLEEKAETYEKAMEFMEKFGKTNGSCSCGELTAKFDKTTRQGVKDKNKYCSGLVEKGTEILKGLL